MFPIKIFVAVTVVKFYSQNVFTDYSGPAIWTKLRKSLLKQQTNSKKTKQTHTQCSLGGDSIGSMSEHTDNHNRAIMV